MTSDGLKQDTVFDLSKLLPGRVVHLIEPVHMPGESPRKRNALIKDVSPFSITLLTVRMNGHENNHLTGEMNETTYPVSAFEGIGCYALKLINDTNEE